MYIVLLVRYCRIYIFSYSLHSPYAVVIGYVYFSLYSHGSGVLNLPFLFTADAFSIFKIPLGLVVEDYVKNKRFKIWEVSVLLEYL